MYFYLIFLNHLIYIYGVNFNKICKTDCSETHVLIYQGLSAGCNLWMGYLSFVLRVFGIGPVRQTIQPDAVLSQNLTPYVTYCQPQANVLMNSISWSHNHHRHHFLHSHSVFANGYWNWASSSTCTLISNCWTLVHLPSAGRRWLGCIRLLGSGNRRPGWRQTPSSTNSYYWC